MAIVDDADYAAQVVSWRQKVPASGWIDDILSLGFELDGRRILDCGCGNGKYGALLTNRGAVVVGVDREPVCVEESNGNSPCYEHVVLGTLANMPFSDNAFDLALMRYVIHLVPQDDRDAVLTEVHRTVKPGGAVIVETAFREQYSSHHDHVIFPRLTEAISSYYPEYDELSATLTRAGFVSVSRSETVQVKPNRKTVEEMLTESRQLVEQGRGQTAWLCLSRDDRMAFHEAREYWLPRMFGSQGVPQVWVGSFVVGRSRPTR